MHEAPSEDDEFRRRIELGRRIQSLRDHIDLRQDAFALKAGIGRTTLQQIEGGKSTPRITTLQAIARALDMPLSRVLGEGALDRDRGGEEGGVPPEPPARKRHP